MTLCWTVYRAVRHHAAAVRHVRHYMRHYVRHIGAAGLVVATLVCVTVPGWWQMPPRAAQSPPAMMAPGPASVAAAPMGIFPPGGVPALVRGGPVDIPEPSSLGLLAAALLALSCTKMVTTWRRRASIRNNEPQ